jgi:hypothetical protein
MSYNEYANLFLEKSGTPCGIHISGPSWGFNNWTTMLVESWQQGRTLNNANYLTPHLLYSGDEWLEYIAPQLSAITNNWVYTRDYLRETNRYYLNRFSTNNYIQQTYDPNIYPPYGLRHLYWLDAVYNDNIIYTLEEDWYYSYPYNPETDFDSFQICKVVFDEDGNTTKEIIHEFLSEVYINGEEFYWEEFYFFGRVKSGIDDCIVTILTYSGSGSPEYYWKVVVYHIDTNTISEQWVRPLDEDVDISGIDWQSTSPAFYQSKMIFSYIVEINNLPSSPPYGSHCFNPVFILDISNDSVEIVQDHQIDLDVDWAYVGMWDATGIIDYNTNKFYWIGWYESEIDDNLWGQFLYEMSIDTPHNTTMFSKCPSNYMQIYQGPTTGYEVDLSNAPGICNVLGIPYHTNITTVEAMVPHGSGHNEAGSIISIEEDGSILWNIRLDRIEGKSITGEEDKTVMINWENGIIPFTYLGDGDKTVRMQIMDNMAIVSIHSAKLYFNPEIENDLRTDWYLLKAADSYTLPTLSFSTNDTSDYFSFDFEFSDESEMTVNWGDYEPTESSATFLEHTYSYADFRTITLSCPDFSKLITFISENGGFINTLPNFQICSNIATWKIYDNNFSSTLPYFGDCGYLTTFDCHNNNLSGEMPLFPYCSRLISFDCSNNNLENSFYWHGSSFPSLEKATQLVTFNASNNNFTCSDTYSFYRSFATTTINFENNNFTEDGVNTLLYILALSIDDFGPRAICTVNLLGPNMSPVTTGNPPSIPNGILAKSKLTDAGWTVLTN